MGSVTKGQQDRDRLREYEARLDTARESVAVLARFVHEREARGTGRALEVEFAETQVESGGSPLPAAVWVALRHDDIDAVIETLVEHAVEQFVIAEHEQLDVGYRLTTVAEHRGLPDVDALIAQLAAFLQVPRDVVSMVAGWGPDDPRTLGEIDRLVDQRYQGRVTAAGHPQRSSPGASIESPPTTAGADARRPALAMSSAEFAALLSLTPEQQAALATLVRQADVTVVGDPAS